MEVSFSCFLPLVLYGLTVCKKLLEDKNDMFDDKFNEDGDSWNDWHEQSFANIIPGQCPLFMSPLKNQKTSGVLVFLEGIVL